MLRYVVVVVVVVASASASIQLPPDVTICSAKDSNINQCFKETANKLIPHLAKGVNGLTLQPLDPLSVPELKLDQGNKLIPTLTFVLTNGSHTGLRHSRIMSADINLKEHKFGFTLFIPQYEIITQYEASGSVAAVPLQGSGPCNLTLQNATMEMTLTGEPVTRNEETFFKMKNFKMKSDMDRIIAKVENLFNNKFLSDTANSLLNLAGKSLVTASLPVFDNLFAEYYGDQIGRMFDTTPYKQLFSDVEL